MPALVAPASTAASGTPVAAATNVLAAHPVAATDTSFRLARPEALNAMLQASRRDTLTTFAAYEAALAGLSGVVPCHLELNPPLWELGHVGWFQAHWLGRNPEWRLGARADPLAPRRAASRADADSLYDSSAVPHASRWHLPLPDADTTRTELALVLDESLALLMQLDLLELQNLQNLQGSPGLRDVQRFQGTQTTTPDTSAIDTALYFHRLCLAHEDMHHEAAIYMAQALGIALADPRFQHRTLPAPGPALALSAAAFERGSLASNGFAFDNECGLQPHQLRPFSIDSQVLRWGDYLPFVEAGGYGDPRWWPGPAAAWRATPGQAAPRYLQRSGGRLPAWQQWRHGRWQALALDEPACHLTAYEADAWCAWAGRRLPTEAEWQSAATALRGPFVWGDVWEWTASTFGPYDGFTPHPYRDYSAPWFGSRRVLRGASLATQRRMHDVRYRNFYTPERNDIFAGFRTCAA